MINEKKLDGQDFAKIILRGASNFKRHIEEINDLNVFPIPDGDTGDNMYMTLDGGIREIVHLTSKSIGKVAKCLADGMLLSARGNSGVILSQLFAGFSKGIGDKEEASLTDVCYALKMSIKQAYSAVSQPVEGTMLTVARETSDKANAIVNQVNSAKEFGEECLKEVKKSLDRTPELLAVLKEAGVVDSGGAGLFYLVQGMVGKAGAEEFEEVAVTVASNKLDLTKFNKDSVMEFGYCTECLLQLQSIKVDVDAFDIKVIIEYLETIGDSVVCFKTDSIVKLHVHTLTPYKVLEFCHQFGEFLTVKIENMTLQNNEVKNNKESNEEKFTKKRPHKKFALVTVALGKGLIDAFYELGADLVIEGGQTKNPSVEDFLKAFDEVNADEIFVLPNNSNIIMAAQKAIEIYKGAKVHLIRTKNIGQAYSILSTLDYSSNDGTIIAGGMKENMEGTITANVTSSVRDAKINNVTIKSGEYIGFTDKEMRFSSPDKLQTLEGLLDTLNIENKMFLIAVYGQSITPEEKLKTEEIVRNKYKDIEFFELDGGQEVYDYILIIE